MGAKLNMFSVNGGIETGFVNIVSSNNGGLSNDQISEMATNKIVAVSETAPEPIRQQAQAFSDNVRNVVHYQREAGHPDLADTIRRL
jgi:hypothetical protein